jgi:UDP-GlcNAc:undecaprenyl-phosphate GlcNAc-1-phosphate transferase
LGEVSLYKPLILLFFSSLLLSLYLTPAAIRAARRIGAFDRPDEERKIHTRQVPHLGGAAMALSLLVPLLFLPGAGPDRLRWGLLLGAVAAVFVGLLDDLYHLRPWEKFLGEVAAASLFVFAGGASLPSLGDLFGTGAIRTGALAPYITVFCMVGVMNALNLSDGLDGLAGGIAVIAAFFLGLFAFGRGDWATFSVLVALLGALLGFLRYNSYPAILFMGDSGSLLLGFTLSASAVCLAGKEGGAVPPVTAGAVLALPILDTLLVMGRRLRRGEHPFYPDRSHLHHRLLDLGLSHAAVVPVLYAATAAFGFLAVAVRHLPEPIQLASVLLLGAAVYAPVYWLRYRGVPSGLRSFLATTPKGRSGDRLSAWAGRSVPVASLVFVAGLAAPAFAPGVVSGKAGFVALCAACFLAIFFPWRSHVSRSGVCYGLLYTGCVTLVAVYHFHLGESAWIPAWMGGLSVAALLWVGLKVRAKEHHRRVIAPSGFEALFFGAALFVPTVLAPVARFPEAARSAILTACLESIPLLFALKILVRKQPRRNFLFAGGLVAALVLVGFRGLWDGGDGFRRLLGPAPAASTVPAPVPAPRAPERLSLLQGEGVGKGTNAASGGGIR